MNKQFAKVIVNPAAGANSTRRKWPGIQNMLKACGISFDYQFTEGKGHAIELARLAANNGYSFLVAVGGDGTVNEVANGLMGNNHSEETLLGIISTGTGSDLPRSIGLSQNYKVACTRLTNPRKLVVDLGLIEYREKGQLRKRHFVNSAGIGFDAEVVKATERWPKYLGGTIPYLAGLLRSFIGYRNKKVSFRIGDKIEKARVLSIVIANGQFFGGGMKIAPEASLDDNLLDIIIVGDVGKIELLQALPRVYKGTHLTHPKVRLEKGSSMTIDSEEKFLLHADGELLGEGPVSFQVIPKALNLVI